jgi:ABC-type polysaccharide/polyol phosphate export permease
MPSVVAELLRYSPLVKNLVFKDLKLKYRDSVLGVVWSLLNPLLLLVVYTVCTSGGPGGPVRPRLQAMSLPARSAQA